MKEKVCLGHLPSFLVGHSDYKIVAKKDCEICIREKKWKDTQ